MESGIGVRKMGNRSITILSSVFEKNSKNEKNGAK